MQTVLLECTTCGERFSVPEQHASGSCPRCDTWLAGVACASCGQIGLVVEGHQPPCFRCGEPLRATPSNLRPLSEVEGLERSEVASPPRRSVPDETAHWSEWRPAPNHGFTHALVVVFYVAACATFFVGMLEALAIRGSHRGWVTAVAVAATLLSTAIWCFMARALEYLVRLDQRSDDPTLHQ